MNLLIAVAEKCKDNPPTTTEAIIYVALILGFAICFAAWRFTGGSFDF